METFHGGTQCCVNQWFLTDRAQESLIWNETDRYFLKFRYYFQEYVPGPTPSHKHLHHWVFLIDANVDGGDEEDNFPERYGMPSVGKITANLTGADMGLEDVPTTYSRIIPLVMTPHCHAPDCIREELWNADTNEIICNVSINYGDDAYGNRSMVFNEANYVAIPPCLWGYQAGLQTPLQNLTAKTNLRAVKYFRNTYRHVGQMAQWTGLMIYDTDPY